MFAGQIPAYVMVQGKDGVMECVIVYSTQYCLKLFNSTLALNNFYYITVFLLEPAEWKT